MYGIRFVTTAYQPTNQPTDQPTEQSPPTLKAMERKKREKLAEMGMTLEEFEAMKEQKKEEERAARREAKRNNTMSPDYKCVLEGGEIGWVMHGGPGGVMVPSTLSHTHNHTHTHTRYQPLSSSPTQGEAVAADAGAVAGPGVPCQGPETPERVAGAADGGDAAQDFRDHEARVGAGRRVCVCVCVCVCCVLYVCVLCVLCVESVGPSGRRRHCRRRRRRQVRFLL
jgi:hypothetical protein